MIKKFKLLIILFLLTSVTSAYSEQTGPATEYKMTIHKLELCADGSTFTTTWNCINGVDVSGGSVGEAIDIGSAAIGIGQAAATLGNFGKVKTGVKYTHIITTLSRDFQITGSTALCSTAGDGAKTTNVGDDTGRGASAPNTTTPVSSKLWVPAMNNQSAHRGIRSVSDAAGSNPEPGGTLDADHLFFQNVGALAKPYVLKPGQIPTVTMSFGTLNALHAKTQGDCAASGNEMSAYYPDTSLTIQGQ